jgi:hypothetical protein
MVMSVGFGARAATFFNGNTVFANCSSSDVKYLDCLTCVGGMADVMGSGNAVNGFTSCIPAGVKLQQVADVAKQFLAAHPAWRQAAARLVAQALADAFPCL